MERRRPFDGRLCGLHECVCARVCVRDHLFESPVDFGRGPRPRIRPQRSAMSSATASANALRSSARIGWFTRQRSRCSTARLTSSIHSASHYRNRSACNDLPSLAQRCTNWPGGTQAGSFHELVFSQFVQLLCMNRQCQRRTRFGRCMRPAIRTRAGSSCSNLARQPLYERLRATGLGRPPTGVGRLVEFAASGRGHWPACSRHAGSTVRLESGEVAPSSALVQLDLCQSVHPVTHVARAPAQQRAAGHDEPRRPCVRSPAGVDLD